MTTQTHISYKVSKALKEFLGESAPEPMEFRYWFVSNKHEDYTYADFVQGGLKEAQEKCAVHKNVHTPYPQYALHDLLSKPFCEAMAGKIKPFKVGAAEVKGFWRIRVHLYSEYQEGGLPAVEAELMKMMGNEAKEAK